MYIINVNHNKNDTRFHMRDTTTTWARE